MRRISFDGTEESRIIFALMVRGWVSGGEPRGKEENALASEIMKKLWALDADKGEATTITLRSDGGALELTEREFELLRRHVEAAPFPAALSPKTGPMYELLAGAEKVTQTSDETEKLRAVS